MERSRRSSRAVGQEEVRPPLVEPGEGAGAPSVEAAAAAPAATLPAVVNPVAAEEPNMWARTPIPPEPEVPDVSTVNRSDFRDEAQSALAETRRVLADGVQALSEELAGLARRGIDTAARAAIGVLGARNLADAIAVNTGFAGASFGNWAGSAVKLSELGIRFADECSRPLVDRLGGGRSRLIMASPDVKPEV